MSEDVKDAFVCPNCHSDQIQSYELIYAQNVSSSTHTTTGVGISTGGGLGSGVATTSGTSVTALGEVVAPPMMKSGMTFKKGCLVYIGLGFLLLPIYAIAAFTDSTFFYFLETAIFFGVVYYFYKKQFYLNTLYFQI